ncbi:MAG TPA: polyphenol oxidase family protein [Longimicrobiales bacterium]|nr:polyphenol oxidase family protein [Longimicrobiales bacterium]
MSIERGTARPPHVRETFDPGVPALVHPGWAESFSWLVQGTTTRGAPGRELDLGLFSGGSPEAVVHRNWGRLLALGGMAAAVHARQLHEAEVRFHADVRSGLRLAEPCDGHATDQPGVLLTVSVADCVPVFVVAPGARAVAALHAGWRGTVAGVLERGLLVLEERTGEAARELHVHLGPSICGSCYEVGLEVFAALDQPVPRAPRPIDLRGVLAARAVAAGVDASRLSVSTHCTRCTRSGLFSHRGGDRGRQVGYIGVRP